MPGNHWTPISGSTTRKDGIYRLTGKRRTASTIKLLQGERLNLGMHLSGCPKLGVHFLPLFCKQPVTAAVNLLKWHYKVHILWISASDYQLVDPSRDRIDVQGIIDGELFRLRTSGFTYMQNPAIGSTKGSHDAALIVQDFPQPFHVGGKVLTSIGI